MTKFKFGDRVKVVEGTEDGGDDHLIGLAGFIVRTDDDYYYEVQLDGHGQDTFQFGCYQLEKFSD